MSILGATFMGLKERTLVNVVKSVSPGLILALSVQMFSTASAPAVPSSACTLETTSPPTPSLRWIFAHAKTLLRVYRVRRAEALAQTFEKPGLVASLAWTSGLKVRLPGHRLQQRSKAYHTWTVDRSHVVQSLCPLKSVTTHCVLPKPCQ